MHDFLKLIQYNHFLQLLRFLLFIAPQKINKHTDQLIGQRIAFDQILSMAMFGQDSKNISQL